MLLVFQITIIQYWQSLYEVGAPCEVKGGTSDAKFGSMTFDELWTLDNTLITFILSYILLSTLIAFQNAKAFLI